LRDSEVAKFEKGRQEVLEASLERVTASRVDNSVAFFRSADAVLNQIQGDAIVSKAIGSCIW
jgi:hypothetical protein